MSVAENIELRLNRVYYVNNTRNEIAEIQSLGLKETIQVIKTFRHGGALIDRVTK